VRPPSLFRRFAFLVVAIAIVVTVVQRSAPVLVPHVVGGSMGDLVHSVTLRGDNPADTKYFDASSRIKSFAPNPGRNIAMVYKVLF
jgi:hypothetical protein